MSYGWRDVEGTFVELCDECGFDSRLVGDEVGRLGSTYDELSRLLELPGADRRPAPETWSAQEYVEHSIEVAHALLDYVARVTGRQLPATASELTATKSLTVEVVGGLDAEDRQKLLHDEYPFPVPVEWLVRHLLHDLEHHVLDIRRGYAGLALADLPVVHTVTR